MTSEERMEGLGKQGEKAFSLEAATDIAQGTAGHLTLQAHLSFLSRKTAQLTIREDVVWGQNRLLTLLICWPISTPMHSEGDHQLTEEGGG